MLIKIVRISNVAFFEFFGQDSCRAALSAYQENRGWSSLQGRKQKTVYLLLKVGNFVWLTNKLLQIRHIDISLTQGRGLQIYDKHLLNLMTNRIFDMPDVHVDPNAPIRVNVLLPAFSIESISAGFFGVFNVARFIKQCGYQVRIVLFDNFHYSQELFRNSLRNFPSFSNLLEEVEIEYIGERQAPLTVSPNDGVVATVWYSAYFAEKIQKTINPQRPFLYLIQDYETAFFPFSSLNAFSDRAYLMSYNALVSTATLLTYMQQFKRFCAGKQMVSFDNACSSILPSWETFKNTKQGRKKRFVFYSRPAVNRNMFELAALSIIQAFDEGAFGDASDWEFYGMDLGDVEIKLSPQMSITQIPRMTLKEYEESMYAFDVCLSLMASPHPSIVPFDLASVGGLVVTNHFATKDAAYFNNISKNIFVAEPFPADIVRSIKEAVAKVDDFEGRYKNAQATNYPNSWNEVWKQEHVDLINNTFK
ncbi:MAG: hypothetical protein KGZ80_03235 [Methylomonas sp.]|nr:hypothetical protein [Methylomonas sp.]